MKRAEMTIKNLSIGGTNPVRIMGIVNLSPESFYQGSVVRSEEDLRNRISAIERQGADLIDVGGASTAPSKTYGTPETGKEVELERVRSSMGLISGMTTLPISIDTTSSEVAETALDLGASLVNDVSGLRGDPEMAGLLAEREVPVIVMARCPDGCLDLEASYLALKESVGLAQESGIGKENLILDPGIGFGKPPEVDLTILRNLERYGLFRRPLLVGISRKAFIGALLEEIGPEERLGGTIAATTIAVEKGVDIIRTHDVSEAWAAARIGEAFRKEHVPLAQEQVEVFQMDRKEQVEHMLEYVGVGEEIRGALAKKGVMVQILLEEVSVSAALVIKQEMLAVGGDAGYHYDTIDHGIEKTSVLIMGTKAQLERFTAKLSGMSYFRLAGIGKRIQAALDL